MLYNYAAKSATGATLTGVLPAGSFKDLHRQLREQGLFVLSATPASNERALARPVRKRGRRGRISKRDLVTLTSQLAIMTRSGVDLASALRNLAEQSAQPQLRAILAEIHADVLSGKPVSQALSSHEAVFGKSYIAGIAAAEASGRLPEVLNRLAELLRGELRLSGTVRGLLAYPVVLSSISLLVIAGLMLFVLPQFAGVFKQMNMPLPAITQALISLSTELRARWWLWGSLLAGAGTGIATMVVSARGRALMHRLMLNVAIVRNVTRALWLGRALRLLSTMLSSGVPLLDGLRLTRASVRNLVLQDLFRRLEDEVINGRSLAPTFLAAVFVPKAAAQMIATAEQTGTLASVMELVGAFYEEEGESRLREAATILEPLIIVVMGLVVAVVVMSVMLPVFDFSTVAH